mmetsp:Transcript_60432/g.189284  ORF Transcript_60432/g.189284 Transcript_60432/m.189284 type:complete len:289 (-) Transcript_60432:455-1321(-)
MHARPPQPPSPQSLHLLHGQLGRPHPVLRHTTRVYAPFHELLRPAPRADQELGRLMASLRTEGSDVLHCLQVLPVHDDNSHAPGRVFNALQDVLQPPFPRSVILCSLVVMETHELDGGLVCEEARLVGRGLEVDPHDAMPQRGRRRRRRGGGRQRRRGGRRPAGGSARHRGRCCGRSSEKRGGLARWPREGRAGRGGPGQTALQVGQHLPEAGGHLPQLHHNELDAGAIHVPLPASVHAHGKLQDAGPIRLERLQELRDAHFQGGLAGARGQPRHSVEEALEALRGLV